MKLNFIILSILLLCSLDCFAQRPDSLDISNYGSYSEMMDSIFLPMSKSGITSGILLDRVNESAYLDSFHGGSGIDTSSYAHWQQAYYELSLASLGHNMPSIDSIWDSLKVNPAKVQLGILNFDYQRLDTNAFNTHRLVWHQNTIHDSEGIAGNPFLNKHCFVVACLKESLPATGTLFSLDTNFFFGNTGKRIAYFEIDFDDGHGRRTLNPGDTITIHYEPGEKTVQLLVHFTDSTSDSALFALNIYGITEGTIDVDHLNACHSSPEIITGDTWPDANGVYKAAKIELTWYSKNCNSSSYGFKKPIIILDGIDADNSNKERDILIEMNAKLLVKNLLEEEYDIIIADYQQGASMWREMPLPLKRRSYLYGTTWHPIQKKKWLL